MLLSRCDLFSVCYYYDSWLYQEVFSDSHILRGLVVSAKDTGTQAEGDCSVAERLGVSLLTNRPINALPMPGITNDLRICVI